MLILLLVSFVFRSLPSRRMPKGTLCGLFLIFLLGFFSASPCFRGGFWFLVVAPPRCAALP